MRPPLEVFDPHIYRPYPRHAPASAVTVSVPRKVTEGRFMRLARKKMEEAAKALDFLSAARYRDEMYELMKLRK